MSAPAKHAYSKKSRYNDEPGQLYRWRVWDVNTYLAVSGIRSHMPMVKGSPTPA